MGWNVGSTPSSSNSVMGFKLSMMAFRSAVMVTTSSAVRPMRAYSAMPRTSVSERCCVMNRAPSPGTAAPLRPALPVR